jgi:hypothetical protein
MTSIEAPRPLNLGEILDRTVQLYRDRFLVYLGIAIIPTGVLLISAGAGFLVLAWFGTWSGTGSAGPFNTPQKTALVIVLLGVGALVALPVLLGASSLSAAAMNHAAAGALAGRRPTIRGSFAEAWRRGWMYVGLYVLEALVVWVAPVGVWTVAFTFLTALLVGGGRGASGPAAGALFGLATVVGFAAIAGYALWMLLCVSLAFPGCVVERIDAGAALKRSFRLSKGTRGRIFVLYLLGAVLGWVLSMVVTIILVIAMALIPGLNSPQRAQAAGMAMVFLIYGTSFAMQAFTKPVYAIALMLFYYDQRIRKEGFDIEWMMERAGLMPVAAVAASGVPPAGSSGEPAAAPDSETRGAVADSVVVPAEMESAFAGQGSGAGHAENTARVTAQTGAPEAVDATEATQPVESTPPENGVKG